MENPLKAKIEKLDNAFLFLLALVSFLISLTQVAWKDISLFIDAIPFIFIGIILPFYIGYIKGALELDSLEMRLRGWIYLIVGTTSYFALTLSGWLLAIANIPYIVRELFLFLALFLCIFITLRFLTWSKRIFSRRSPLNQFTLSATVASAFVYSTALALIIAYYHDVLGKGLLSVILSGPQSLFLTLIILCALSISLMLEKACNSALNVQISYSISSGKQVRFLKYKFFRGLRLSSIFLEYTFDYNLKSRMLWLLSFVYWVIASILWAFNAIVLSEALFIISIVAVMLGDLIFYFRSDPITFEGIRNVRTRKSSNMLYIFLFTTLMILGFSILLSVIGIIIVGIYSLIPQKWLER